MDVKTNSTNNSLSNGIYNVSGTSWGITKRGDFVGNSLLLGTDPADTNKQLKYTDLTTIKLFGSGTKQTTILPDSIILSASKKTATNVPLSIEVTATNLIIIYEGSDGTLATKTIDWSVIAGRF